MLGISRGLGYELIREGRFPAPVIKAGTRYVVPLRPLQKLLGLADQDGDAPCPEERSTSNEATSAPNNSQFL